MFAIDSTMSEENKGTPFDRDAGSHVDLPIRRLFHAFLARVPIVLPPPQAEPLWPVHFVLSVAAVPRPALTAHPGHLVEH